ncbi:MAG: DinB family protein [Gemmatimonadaceae bacterium]
MTRDQILRKLEAAWRAFEDSYAGLTGAQLRTPGVTGQWSVRDIIAHVTWWEEEALKYLPRVRQGERTPRYSVLYGGINAFNAIMTEQRRGLSLADVLRQHDDVHTKLIRYVRRSPEELFARENPFRHRLRADTYGHYPIHARAIRTWRER